MINCAKCGAFISYDSSNLEEICDGCKGELRIKELEAENALLKRQLYGGMNMLAQKVIEQCVKSKYQGKAYVHGEIPEHDTWWHVHRDEEIPEDRPVSVKIYYKGE